MPSCRPRAHRLREAGYDEQAVREVGLREAEDGAIWRHAQTGAVGPVIVWLRIGNTSNAAPRAWLVPQLPELVRLIGQGGRVVGVR